MEKNKSQYKEWYHYSISLYLSKTEVKMILSSIKTKNKMMNFRKTLHSVKLEKDYVCGTICHAFDEDEMKMKSLVLYCNDDEWSKMMKINQKTPYKEGLEMCRWNRFLRKLG